MKNLMWYVAAGLLFTVPAHAQKLSRTQVPAAVAESFKKAYPKVKKVEWEKEGANFEAGFEQNKIETSVIISPTGQLKETETAIAQAALPTAVKQKLATRYKAYKVTEAARIVSADNQVVTYEAEVSKGGKKQDVLFTADGAEVKK